jgi:hypothetical protein
MQTSVQRSHHHHQLASSALSSGSSTVVDTDDVLQRYERLLSQLAQQTIEQQAELQVLRDALQACGCVAASTLVCAVGSQKTAEKARAPPLRKAKRVRRHASSRLHHHHHHCVERQKKLHPAVEAHHESGTNTSFPCTVSPPTSPQVSSIATLEEPGMSSVDTPEVLCGITELDHRSAGFQSPSLSTPRRTPATGDLETPMCGATSRSGQASKDHDAHHTSSVDVSGHSAGLSPSPNTLPCGKKQKGGSWQSPHRNSSAEGLSDGSRTTQQRRRDTTPGSQISIQDPMGFLLSVFSSVEKSGEGGHTEGCRVAASGVMRRLFSEGAGDDDVLSLQGMGTEGQTEVRTSGVHAIHRPHTAKTQKNDGMRAGGALMDDGPSSCAHPSSSLASCLPGASWEERYARIVAITSGVVKDGNSGALPCFTQISHHDISFSHDQSASDLVEELIKFFTI